MLWALENNLDLMPPVAGINYHGGRWSNYFDMQHNDTDQPADFTFGSYCKFNLFLNSWIKFRSADNYNSFNTMSTGQQIFQLSNDVRWRMGSVYASAYDTHIDLDYADIFRDTVSFRKQLIHMLQRAEWPFTDRITQPFVDDAAAQFRASVIDPAAHLGNVHSVGWLAWCQYWCEKENKTIPVDIESQVPEYQSWLQNNQAWILDRTTQYLL
jgi:hypothetical protein